MASRPRRPPAAQLDALDHRADQVERFGPVRPKQHLLQSFDLASVEVRQAWVEQDVEVRRRRQGRSEATQSRSACSAFSRSFIAGS